MHRTFVFADPCGYKGLSLGLLAAALKGYGNDCLFFFNYSRVNMKISYEVMNDSINEFFEIERAEKLRSQVSGVRRKREREQLILTAVKSALFEAGAKAALAFTFKTGEFGRTSHHLVFASKNMRALQMMKNVMEGASSQIAEGVGSLDFTPGPRTLSLFSGLHEMANRLADEYAGRTITFQELTDLEVSQPYTIANYRDAVLRLEAEGFVESDPRSDLRPFQANGEKKDAALQHQPDLQSTTIGTWRRNHPLSGLSRPGTQPQVVMP